MINANICNRLDWIKRDRKSSTNNSLHLDSISISRHCTSDWKCKHKKHQNLLTYRFLRVGNLHLNDIFGVGIVKKHWVEGVVACCKFLMRFCVDTAGPPSTATRTSSAHFPGQSIFIWSIFRSPQTSRRKVCDARRSSPDERFLSPISIFFSFMLDVFT